MMLIGWSRIRPAKTEQSMNTSPIGSNAPKPLEPDRARPAAKDKASSAAPTRGQDTVLANDLANSIGARMTELRAEEPIREDRVEEVREELRDGTLTSRENLEQAAEGMLFGEDVGMIAGE
jgi:anti-sigma28 factor (negative regulator of flagellin synthesis)